MPMIRPPSRVEVSWRQSWSKVVMSTTASPPRGAPSNTEEWPWIWLNGRGTPSHDATSSPRALAQSGPARSAGRRPLSIWPPRNSTSSADAREPVEGRGGPRRRRGRAEIDAPEGRGEPGVRDEVVLAVTGDRRGDAQPPFAPPPPQGGDGAGVEPLSPREGGVAQVLRLVVADQLDPLIRPAGQEVVDQADHARRVGAAMDEVTDLDHGEVGGQRARVRVRAQADQLLAQRLPVAADVTDHGHPAAGPRHVGARDVHASAGR